MLKKDIPHVVFEIYTSLLTNYPTLVSFDREKDEETEYDTKVPEELRLAQDVLNLLAGFTVNLTSCPKLAIEFGKTGLIPVFLGMTEALKDCIPDIIPFEDPETKTISKWTARGRTLSRLLGSLVNMAIQVSNRIVFLDSNGIQHLLPFLQSPVTAFYIKSLFCLAYLVEEEDNRVVMADAEPIKFIIHMLDKAIKSSTRGYLDFSASAIADGISKLAVNENNSKQFGLNGAIPAIFNMLTTSKEDSDERLGGTTALWMLSFDAINRALIKAFPSATDTLQRFAQDSDEKVAKASQGVLWEIETENRDLTRSVTTDSQHIMISYQWDNIKKSYFV